MLPLQLTGIGLKPDDLGFPFDTWRAGQLEMAERIMNSKKKVITLSAPTGFGKSVVIQIPSRITLERQLILTKTKQLQTQYERDGIQALYGRDNYVCLKNQRFTTAQGVCRIGEPCHHYNDGCYYFDQKRIAIASQEATLNYSYFFLEANGPGGFSNYDTIVCDEGHSVPDELSRSFSIRIFFPDCKYHGVKVPRDKTLPSLILWAKQNLPKFRRRAIQASNTDNTNVKIRAIEFEHRVELLAMIDDPEQWVVDLENQTATIRPIWPEALAQFNLWPHAKRFIFSSATMNAQYTLSMLGFDPNDADILEAPSSFAKEYRPIFLRSDLILNYKSMQDHTILRKWVDQIDEIISMYPDHKGLIHTGNYQLANLLTINSRHANRLLSHTAETRLITLERFKDLTEPKVLVSPSMTEGVDLPYEKCRFQIIGKIPYPNMIDKVWNARFEQNKEKAGTIYRQATIDQVVQATGRGMRADDDYCETWIIDGNILRLLQYTADFPKFFREAIRRV